jgi:hypothetical protein
VNGDIEKTHIMSFRSLNEGRPTETARIDTRAHCELRHCGGKTPGLSYYLPLDISKWIASCPGRFTTREEDRETFLTPWRRKGLSPLSQIKSNSKIWPCRSKPSHHIVSATCFLKHSAFNVRSTITRGYFPSCVISKILLLILLLLFPVARQPIVGQILLIIEASRSHTVRHTTLLRTPLDE